MSDEAREAREVVRANAIEIEPPRRRFVWAASFALFTVTGLFRFTYKYFDDIARGESGTLARRVIEETTGTYAAMALFVGVVYFTWRLPLDRPGWRRRIGPHLCAMVAYSVAHTMLLLISRSAIFAVAGLGAYDYGYMPARFVMEFGNDAVSYLVYIAFIVTYRNYRTARERELRTAQLERGLAQAEMRNLRLQLHPHFLFNALNTISSTMYDDPRAADRMIGQLSELLRLSLRTSHTQEVPLREELDVLSLYVGLMRARFGERLRIEIELGQDAEDALVPSLLLQPLVENAVRHGNASRIGRGTIAVRAERAGEVTRIVVADDGPGAASGTDIFGAGIGLSATRDRLRLMYGSSHRFTAGNEGGGFAVTILVPYRPARSAASGDTGVASAPATTRVASGADLEDVPRRVSAPPTAAAT